MIYLIGMVLLLSFAWTRDDIDNEYYLEKSGMPRYLQSYSSSSSSYKSSSKSYKSTSKSYKSSYNKAYKAVAGSTYSSTKGVYSTYANTVTYTNTYWNSATGKTYQPLYVYYKPANYYNKIGYYSTTFLLIYYDGYGYNFYYGEYGYYEYSVNESRGGSSGSLWALIPVVFIGVGVFIVWRKCKAQGEVEPMPEHMP
jgi:hypothetical protein